MEDFKASGYKEGFGGKSLIFAINDSTLKINNLSYREIRKKNYSILKHDVS